MEILKEFSLVMLDTRVFLELFFIPFCMLIVSKLSIRYLLTPLRNPATDAQRRYNRAHIQTRNVVERSIGILKRRFPCSSSTLAYQPEKVGKIMTVCAILHNIAIECQDQEEFLPDPNYVDDVFIDDNIPGLAARNVFIQTYFA
jgi:hypothetical protein